MKFTSPKLNVAEEATNDLIESSITALKVEVDSFAILASDDMNYVQALVAEQGFVVQFQYESIDQHYEFDTYLSRPQTIALFQSYLAKNPSWQGKLPYSIVNLRGFWGTLGLILGRFIGGLFRSFKGGQRKT